MPTGPVPYGDRLTQLAAERGDAPALVFSPQDGPDRTYSWSDLDRRSNQHGRLLQERGVTEGDIVVVALPDSPDHVTVAFGAWKLGASVLPLRRDMPPWERHRLLAIAGHRVVVSGWSGVEANVALAELDRAATRDDSPLPAGLVPRHSRLIATSGSTRTPKIIVGSAPGVYSVEEEERKGNVTAGAGVVLCTSPLYHTNGAVSCFAPLMSGSKVVLLEHFDAARAVDLIERYRVTGTILVPTMLQRIARLEGVRDRDFSSLLFVHYGGATLPEWVARTWLELIPPERFVFSYGGSENLGLAMCTGREWLERPGTVGRPVNCDIAILDEDGLVLAPGHIGQIFMRKHDEPDPFRYIGVATPEPVLGGYRTLGDMGWLDEEGFLYIADRRHDMIVTGGVNVFPAEVEAAVSEHPAVMDVVVIGLPDPEWGHRVHAVVELAAGSVPPGEEALRSFCRERLAGPKVPKSFEFVAGLPRTTAGKINRSRLVEERATGRPARA